MASPTEAQQVRALLARARAALDARDGNLPAVLATVAAHLARDGCLAEPRADRPARGGNRIGLPADEGIVELPDPAVPPPRAIAGRPVTVPDGSLSLSQYLIDEPDPRLAPPAGIRRPELLGTLYEALRAPSDRRRRGAFYTPPEIATAIVAAARELLRRPVRSVCDPAVGGGAFLLAAWRAAVATGQPPPRLYGADTDPLALAVTRAALGLVGTTATLHRGDAVAEIRWGAAPFDLVLGNPPFQNQLRTRTARSPARAAALAERFGAPVRGYVDGAAEFLLLSLELVADGGAVGMIVPQSLLATRAAHALRDVLAARLRGVWVDGGVVFAHGTPVCALLLGDPAGGAVTLTRRHGPTFATQPAFTTTVAALRAAPTWSRFAAGADQLPPVALRASGTLGDHCQATADFRDAYYGLVGHVRDREHGDGPRLITTGLIDPARTLWGHRPARFANQRYTWPRVALDRLEQPMRAWADRRLVPKVLVATQTRVLEAAVDAGGTWLPCTPVITVTAPAQRLWHVAAALLAPPVTAWALSQHGGAGLSAGALKLRAAEVVDLPAPVDHGAWDEGAAAVRAAAAAVAPAPRATALEALGIAMSAAYGVADAGLLDWWLQRLPRR